jgi:hypothetical protein
VRSFIFLFLTLNRFSRLEKIRKIYWFRLYTM